MGDMGCRHNDVKCEGLGVSLDSKIECIFYEKCMEKSALALIWLEWANSKKIYCSHTNMILGMYGNYSRHDSSHSVSILGSVWAVIGEERIKNMSVMDLWLLLHCAYAHDTGMPYSYDEAVELWESVKDSSEFAAFLEECSISDDEDIRHAVRYIKAITDKLIPEKNREEKKEMLAEKFSYSWPAKVNRYYMYLTAEYCRQRHARRSREVVQKKFVEEKAASPYNVEDRLYKLVGVCSEMHGRNFEDLLRMDKEEFTPVGECHPKFIAALLRLGDLLDIDNNRFDTVALAYYGNLNKISAIHKKKHEAIVHIAYGISKIEIRAESDDEDVCKCAGVWFQYLDEEVKNIIFHWSEIAPKEVGGCQFSVPKTEIYLKGQLFREVANHEFQVNKEMLINLVIGRNLYRSKLDFIREYLQNSLDAVKMKLWLELKEDPSTYYINPKYAENWKAENIASIEPFQISEYIYENYRIDVACEWDESDKEHPIVNIKITDKGIGIDEECVDAISHIGSGWKRRRRYRNDLEKMPNWLKPTGGFGIGMQSGFMIADTIKIETKCENEIAGREIILHSSTTSGRIEEKKIERERKGTSIEVKIPYEWFLEERNWNCYKLKIKEVNDYFGRNDIMNAVYEVVSGYVKTMASNSLFPIYIKRENFISNRTGNIIHNNIESDTPNPIEGKYKIFHDAEKVYIWDREKAVLCTIRTKDNSADEILTWAYKGMKVGTEYDRKEIAIAKPFGNISIDIMGIKVEDCLTIDRSNFKPEFDHFALLLQFLKVYINSFDDISKLFEGNIFAREKKDISQKDCYKFLICERLLENEEQRKTIRKFLGEVNGDDVMLMNDMSLLVEVAQIEKDKDDFLIRKNLLPNICKAVWVNQTANFLFCNRKYNFAGMKVSPSMQKYAGKDLIADKEIYDIMCMRPNEMIVLDQELKIECIRLKTLNSNMEEEKKTVFGNAIDRGGSQQIFWTEKYYEELWVTSIPFTNVQNYQKYQEHVKNNKKMIISPINPSSSSTELIVSELIGKQDTKKCFRDYVKKNGNFQYLLDWVVEHQFVSGQYSRDEIETGYTNLIDFIYENEVARIMNKK